jgi:hypothetical protein
MSYSKASNFWVLVNWHRNAAWPSSLLVTMAEPFRLQKGERALVISGRLNN